MLAVGITAEGHYIVENTWGAYWGMDGYIIIDKDNNCNMCRWEVYYPAL